MQLSLTHYKGLFLEHLTRVKKASPLTVRTYAMALDEMIAYVDVQIEVDQTILFLMPLRQHIAKQNKKTIAKKLSACRSFVAYVNEVHTMHWILKDDTPLKVQRGLPKPISHAHILEALKEANVPERTLVLMLYGLGLRISELSSMTLDAMKPRWVRIVGKGGKIRDVPVSQGLEKLIHSYIQATQPKTFFFEENGQRLSEDSLRYKLNKIFKRIGIKVTPHQLRHAYATELLNGGARIEEVSELLGHDSLATTQIYTQLATNVKMQNYLQAHPLGTKEEQ